jgi:hypothetical protein
MMSGTFRFPDAAKRRAGSQFGLEAGSRLSGCALGRDT